MNADILIRPDNRYSIQPTTDGQWRVLDRRTGVFISVRPSYGSAQVLAEQLLREEQSDRNELARVA